MNTALVIGSGRTGQAVVAHALANDRSVVVLDERISDEAAEALAAKGVAVYTEMPDAAYDDMLGHVSVVIPSPGVPYNHPVIVAAQERGIPVRSELDVAVEETDVPIVAVTGTNGKTTVTSLIEAILQASGRVSRAVGNIGIPLIEALDEPTDVFVAEVSSFQLHFVNAPAFRVAVWLNIADDHYDWHPDIEHYAQAKARIMDGQTAADLFVYNADDPLVAEQAARATSRTVGFSLEGRRGCYALRDGRLVAPDGAILMDRSALADAAPHDVANVLAAMAATRDLGVADAIIFEAVQGFRKLPHRVEWICEAGGVQFVDDSKATNPHAAVAAIEGFDRVVLIAGGRNKGLDLSALRTTAPRLVGVVAIGDAADEVETALGDLATTKQASSMAEAVRTAAAMANPGDTVLLSPACASFDWYSGYAERGEDFAAEARAYAAELGA